MGVIISKKAHLILFLAVFYFSTIVLGALCNSSGQSGHMPHQKQGMGHSINCLLACSSMVTREGEIPLLPSALPVFGILLFSIPFTRFQTFASILHSRGPPQAH